MNDDQAEHSDVYDPAHEIEDEDEEPGIYNGDAYPGRTDAYDPDKAWHERMQLTDAIDAIEGRYRALLAPYRDALPRNPGVKPAAMARLEATRDAEISDLIRTHAKMRALDHAARVAPQRAVQAAERQSEQAALNAFGRDLPGGSGRYRTEEFHGRATTDIASW